MWSYPPEMDPRYVPYFVTRTVGRVWIIPPVGFSAASKETVRYNLIILVLNEKPRISSLGFSPTATMHWAIRCSTHRRSAQLRRPWAQSQTLLPSCTFALPDRRQGEASSILILGGTLRDMSTSETLRNYVTPGTPRVSLSLSRN